MIRVRLRTTAEGRPCGLDVAGHAGLEEAGKDVVCAAVSVLAENLAAGLRELARAPVRPRIESGDFSLELEPADLGYETDLLFASALLGLKSVAAGYPERVELSGF